MSAQASTRTRTSQAGLTAAGAIELLREGNARFVAGDPARRDLAEQVRTTAAGQYPFAAVLGCIDSRVPMEIVFDQGIGDIFSARVAGNVVNGDVLGSMEFACAVAGSKAVVVLGHTSCGAVKGAIDDVELGNLTALVDKIQPAVTAVEGARDASNRAYVDAVAETHVRLGLDQIRGRSPVLAEMEANGEIAIVGAMYDVATGAVRFL
ncbi:MAG: carbonic anhydrase [Gemmatimonadetes bacterium]|nr:carbonic anhydrase [Gemmatimonadota bacterium]